MLTTRNQSCLCSRVIQNCLMTSICQVILSNVPSFTHYMWINMQLSLQCISLKMKTFEKKGPSRHCLASYFLFHLLNCQNLINFRDLRSATSVQTQVMFLDQICLYFISRDGRSTRRVWTGKGARMIALCELQTPVKWSSLSLKA